MLVLSVQLNEPPGQLPQVARRRQGAVDKRSTATLTGDLAPDHKILATWLLEDSFD